MPTTSMQSSARAQGKMHTHTHTMISALPNVFSSFSFLFFSSCDARPTKERTPFSFLFFSLSNSTFVYGMLSSTYKMFARLCPSVHIYVRIYTSLYVWTTLSTRPLSFFFSSFFFFLFLSRGQRHKAGLLKRKESQGNSPARVS